MRIRIRNTGIKSMYFADPGIFALMFIQQIFFVLLFNTWFLLYKVVKEVPVCNLQSIHVFLNMYFYTCIFIHVFLLHKKIIFFKSVQITNLNKAKIMV